MLVTYSSRGYPFYSCIMDDRTEPNNCTGTNWYGGTRFWYDIIWFGTWYEILVRNSVVRFVFGLLVRDLWKKSVLNQISGSYQIGTEKAPISNRITSYQITEPRTNYGPSVRKNFEPYQTEPITNRRYDHPCSWFGCQGGLTRFLFRISNQKSVFSRSSHHMNHIKNVFYSEFPMR